MSTAQGCLFSPPVSGEVMLAWLPDGPTWLAKDLSALSAPHAPEG